MRVRKKTTLGNTTDLRHQFPEVSTREPRSPAANLISVAILRLGRQRCEKETAACELRWLGVMRTFCAKLKFPQIQREIIRDSSRHPGKITIGTEPNSTSVRFYDAFQ